MKKIIFLFMLSSLLVSCGGSKGSSTSYPEHSYDEVSSLHIKYDEVFSKDQNEHLIYYYEVSCVHCAELKNEVIEFALKKYKPIYFVVADISTPHVHNYQEINETIGSSDVNDVFVGVTPQLTVIKDGKVSKNILKNEFISEELSHYVI